MVPRNIHTLKSSIISMVAVGNSSKFLGLEFRAILFDEKYNKNMEKFTTLGLSSKIFYRAVLLLREKKDKIKPRKYVNTSSKEVETNGIFSNCRNIFYLYTLVSYRHLCA